MTIGCSFALAPYKVEGKFETKENSSDWDCEVLFAAGCLCGKKTTAVMAIAISIVAIAIAVGIIMALSGFTLPLCSALATSLVKGIGLIGTYILTGSVLAASITAIALASMKLNKT